MSFTSNIAVNIGEKNNQLPTNFFLNNDYVNGYWKLDEGNGNIAYDSSGHNYDGEINGAIWTTGYSSFALDFDGIDDYVELDTYSEDIGFNKTDDLILSVWFNSTTKNEGLIYCMSDSGIIKTLEFSIGLNSNGNIVVHMWDFSCGIILTSTGIFNDGSWHNVKIFYHGSTADSIVEIYVDNNFDISLKEGVCSFIDKDFKRVKIGRRAAESTKYFDGLIDELNITKYPGGNQQVPPDISGPTVGETGVEYEFSFITNDPEEDDIELLIDWSDGTQTGWIGPYESGEEVIISHRWDEDGKYKITAKSMDYWDDSSWSEPFVVGIGNQPPDAPDINGPERGSPGIEYDYTFVTNDPEDDDVFYEIKWGDQTTDDFGPISSGIEIIVNHTWNEKGNYLIETRASDIFGTYGDWEQLEVTIPRYRSINNYLLLDFLKRFPLFERLLSLIRVI